MPTFKRTFEDEFIRDTVQTAVDIMANVNCQNDLRLQAFAAILNMTGQLTVDPDAISVPALHTPGRMLS